MEHRIAGMESNPESTSGEQQTMLQYRLRSRPSSLNSAVLSSRGGKIIVCNFKCISPLLNEK